MKETQRVKKIHTYSRNSYLNCFLYRPRSWSGDFIPWLKWVTTVSVFKARVNKAKGNLDCFLQTFPEIKKFKLMQQKIQKKPQAAGTNEEEHADEEQQFDPEVDFVDMLMAHNLVKMGLEISQRILWKLLFR